MDPVIQRRIGLSEVVQSRVGGAQQKEDGWGSVEWHNEGGWGSVRKGDWWVVQGVCGI